MLEGSKARSTSSSRYNIYAAPGNYLTDPGPNYSIFVSSWKWRFCDRLLIGGLWNANLLGVNSFGMPGATTGLPSSSFLQPGRGGLSKKIWRKGMQFRQVRISGCGGIQVEPDAGPFPVDRFLTQLTANQIPIDVTHTGSGSKRTADFPDQRGSDPNGSQQYTDHLPIRIGSVSSVSVPAFPT
jgi:hypothetical protein